MKAALLAFVALLSCNLALAPTNPEGGAPTNLYSLNKGRIVRVSLHKSETLHITSTGSGVLLDSSTVLTAWHVVDDEKAAYSVQIPKAYDKRGYPTEWEIRGVEKIEVASKTRFPLLKRDYDLALLYLSSSVSTIKTGVTIAEADPEVGSEVCTISFPLDMISVFTKGVVSTYTEVTYWTPFELWGLSNPSRVFGFTAPIAPGSSGGAVFDSKGRLMGIIVASSSRYAGYYWAVPAEDIIEFIKIARNQ